MYFSFDQFFTKNIIFYKLVWCLLQLWERFFNVSLASDSGADPVSRDTEMIYA